MSGRDNPTPQGNGVPDGGNDCSTILETVPLNSPKSEVTSTLKDGSVLKLAIRVEGKRNTLVALDSKGREAGTITTAAQPKIINCIQQGFRFDAIVISIDRGICIIEIRPESK